MLLSAYRARTGQTTSDIPEWPEVGRKHPKISDMVRMIAKHKFTPRHVPPSFAKVGAFHAAQFICLYTEPLFGDFFFAFVGQ